MDYKFNKVSLEQAPDIAADLVTDAVCGYLKKINNVDTLKGLSYGMGIRCFHILFSPFSPPVRIFASIDKHKAQSQIDNCQNVYDLPIHVPSLYGKFYHIRRGMSTCGISGCFLLL